MAGAAVAPPPANVPVAKAPATVTSGAGINARRSAEELALDTTKLYECIREEVVALMLDGVQKTAAFCASLCADKIVEHRREIQRRLADERRELERVYGVGLPLCPSATGGLSPATASACGSLASPATTAFAPLFPPRQRSDAPFTPRQREPGLPPPASSRAAGVAVVYQPDPPASSSPTAKAGSVAGSLRATQLPSATGSPGATAPASQLVDAISVQADPRGSMQLDQQKYESTAALSSAAYDSTFIDAYDAVQTLEERTNMASRAMDLLDEALQAAVDATHSTAEELAADAEFQAALSPLALPSSLGAQATAQALDMALVAAPDALATVAATATAQLAPDIVDRTVDDVGERSNAASEEVEEKLGSASVVVVSPSAPSFTVLHERDRGVGRASRRERSIASNTSGEVSIAAADLHGT